MEVGDRKRGRWTLICTIGVKVKKKRKKKEVRVMLTVPELSHML